MQNYPNPFNPITQINFKLEQHSDIRIDIYSATGQLVRSLVNGEKAAGQHSVVWGGTDDDGHQVASGLYFCTLTATGQQEIRKMILAR